MDGLRLPADSPLQVFTAEDRPGPCALVSETVGTLLSDTIERLRHRRPAGLDLAEARALGRR